MSERVGPSENSPPRGEIRRRLLNDSENAAKCIMGRTPKLPLLHQRNCAPHSSRDVALGTSRQNAAFKRTGMRAKLAHNATGTATTIAEKIDPLPRVERHKIVGLRAMTTAGDSPHMLADIERIEAEAEVSDEHDWPAVA